MEEDVEGKSRGLFLTRYPGIFLGKNKDSQDKFKLKLTGIQG
jgi:hypothetical protein